MNQSTDTTLQNVLTENDLCELLGMTGKQVADLRNKEGLPFIKLNRKTRFYFERDIIEFFTNRRIVLNRSGRE